MHDEGGAGSKEKQRKDIEKQFKHLHWFGEFN